MTLGIRDALVLSPMVDVTDPAFRAIARRYGADVTCSEMVSAAGLVHENPRSRELCERGPDERPYGVQIMGGDPDEMADAVGRVVREVAPEFVDLNLGCPSPNILRSCAGGFLLRDPPGAGRVIRAAVEAAGDTPVSVKMRTGPSGDRPTFLQVGEEAEAAGAAWCTLHGRSVEQMYSGQADWHAIGALVDALSIPVIGNGDIRGPEDVLRMRDETGCAGYFIARAAMHDPTVFRRLRAALDGDPAPPLPAMDERKALAREYVHARPDADVGLLRRQCTRLLAGGPGAKRLRVAMHAATDRDAILATLE